MIALLAEIKKQQAERAASVNLKDSEIFYLLVFSTGWDCCAPTAARVRPLHRIPPRPIPGCRELKREEARIIVP